MKKEEEEKKQALKPFPQPYQARVSQNTFHIRLNTTGGKFQITTLTSSPLPNQPSL